MNKKGLRLQSASGSRVGEKASRQDSIWPAWSGLGGSRVIDFSSFPEGALIKHSFIVKQKPCGTSFPRDMLSVHVQCTQLQGPPLCILKAHITHGQ